MQGKSKSAGQVKGLPAKEWLQQLLPLVFRPRAAGICDEAIHGACRGHMHSLLTTPLHIELQILKWGGQIPSE